MVGKRYHSLAAVAAVAVAWGTSGLAEATAYEHGGPVRATLGAAMKRHTTGNLPGESIYPAPRPTPPWVGHTYIPYQPFAPHEFLHPHYDVYRRFHAQGGWTTTRVRYRTSILGQLPRSPNPAEWMSLYRPWPPR